MASILGAVSALRSYGASYGEAAREDLLATAQEEAERLARFVDNLLDMTRLEAGALGPKREPVDIADAVGTALRRTSRLLADHRVVPTCQSTCRSCGPTSSCWSRSWSTCWRTPPAMRHRIDGGDRRGHRRRGVVARGARSWPRHPSRRGGSDLRPFYRAANATPGKGVGLGLAIARGFVEAMGGTITAV